MKLRVVIIAIVIDEKGAKTQKTFLSKFYMDVNNLRRIFCLMTISDNQRGTLITGN